MIKTVIIVSAIVFAFILCLAMVSTNTDLHEDDYLQEQYLKEWSNKHK